MKMEVFCLMVVLFFILYLAATTVTQNGKYLFSFFCAYVLGDRFKSPRSRIIFPFIYCLRGNFTCKVNN